jgi:tetratricopeptide (TPR) repeat protein
MPPKAASPTPAKCEAAKGEAAFDAKDWKAVIIHYSTALATDPNHGHAYSWHFRMGSAHFGLKEFEQSIASYSKCIELHPSAAAFNLSAAAFNNRACSYRALNRLDEALADCNKSIAIDPVGHNGAFVYRARGQTFEAMGRFELAILDLERSQLLHVSADQVRDCSADIRRVEQKLMCQNGGKRRLELNNARISGGGGAEPDPKRLRSSSTAPTSADKSQLPLPAPAFSSSPSPSSSSLSSSLQPSANDFRRLWEVEGWGVGQVADWVRGFGSAYTGYAEAFTATGIDGITLLTLTADHLSLLGVKNVLHRQRFIAHINHINKPANAAPANTSWRSSWSSSSSSSSASTAVNTTRTGTILVPTAAPHLHRSESIE